jgi:hypothetical protein
MMGAGILLIMGWLALCPAAGQQKSAAAPPAYTISGTVVDGISGAPLGRSRVGIAPVTNREDVRTVNAGDDGRFVFDHVAAGKYSLTAEHRGYVSQAFEQHDQYATSIAAGPELDSEDIVFRMKPEAAISGRVTDEFGEPVRDARVMLFQAGLLAGRRSTFQRGSASTNDLGMYHFSHLPAGKYFVAVVAAPWYARHAFAEENQGGGDQRGAAGSLRAPLPEANPALDVAYPLTFYPSAISSDGAAPVTLAFGDRFVADISVRPVAAVHLRVPLSGVENEDNSAVTVRQMLFDTIPVPIHTESRRAGSGSVAISGIPPGQYVLDVNLWNESRNSTAASLEIEAGPDGQLVAGGDRALARVSGTVKMENPAFPVPQGGVQLRSRKTAAVYIAQMSPKGEFEFRQPIPAGDYSIELSGARGAFVKLVTGTAVAGETIQIRGKAPVKLVVELTEGLGRIDGVVQRDGKPAPAAMVVLVPEDAANNPGRFRRDQSDSDGTFTLASILPGKYTVLAIEKGWDLEWADPEVLKPYLEKGKAVQVEARGKLKVKLEVQ